MSGEENQDQEKKPSKKRGVDPTLTRDIMTQICSYIMRGMTPHKAASAAGISPSTFKLWLGKGRVRNQITRTIYGDLIREMDKAAGRCEVLLLDVVHQAATGKERFRKPEWKAAAWILERINPERFGLRQKLEHSGPDGEPIQTQSVSTLTDADLEERAKAIREKLGLKE